MPRTALAVAEQRRQRRPAAVSLVAEEEGEEEAVCSQLSAASARWEAHRPR